MRFLEVAPAVAGVVLLSLGGRAVAQQPARRRPAPTQVQNPALQGDVPQSTTATYADWVVQCVTRAGTPPEKLCEMAQVTQLQGKNVPFSRIAVEHPVKDEPVKLIVQVPVNASFATPVRIQISDADPGVTVAFARCVPGGCFAEFGLKEEALRKFRSARGVGKLSFADAGGHEVSVPLSFNGFAQAYEALLKE